MINISNGQRLSREVVPTTVTKQLYVRTDGSDSNSGLANTSGGAFLTIQRAINEAYRFHVQPPSADVCINVADGTYAENLTITGVLAGTTSIWLKGNVSTPANVILDGSGIGGMAVTVTNGGALGIEGFHFQDYTSGHLSVRGAGSQIQIYGELRFGACTAGTHMTADHGALITDNGGYAIVGGAVYHLIVADGGHFRQFDQTITLTGTPAFSGAFIAAVRGGGAHFEDVLYSGSATGTRYAIGQGAWIQTEGAGASFFPGNAAGSGGTTPEGFYI